MDWEPRYVYIPPFYSPPDLHIIFPDFEYPDPPPVRPYFDGGRWPCPEPEVPFFSVEAAEELLRVLKEYFREQDAIRVQDQWIRARQLERLAEGQERRDRERDMRMGFSRAMKLRQLGGVLDLRSGFKGSLSRLAVQACVPR